MNLKVVLKKQYYSIWVCAVLCVLLFVGYSGAETKSVQTKKAYVEIKKNFKDPKLIQTIAKVMEVNTSESYIVIAENEYYVARFKIDGKMNQTVLKNTAGEEIDMNGFEKRDLVKVTSIALDIKKAKYVALKIEMLPPRD